MGILPMPGHGAGGPWQEFLHFFTLLLRENAKLAGRGAGSKKELRFLSVEEIAQSRPTL